MLTIVFDLDGTLIDTAPDLIDTLNLILGREGFAAVPFDTARPMIGGGARGMIERALRPKGSIRRQIEVERMFGAFIAHYSEHIADRSRPYPGLEATLDGLGVAGYRLAVCTNKLEWLALRLLDALDLTRRFAFDVRPGHLRRPEAQSADAATDHRERRRRAVTRRHDRQLHHRYPHRPRRRRAGRRRRFRL